MLVVSRMERKMDFLGCDLFLSMKRIAKIGLTSYITSRGQSLDGILIPRDEIMSAVVGRWDWIILFCLTGLSVSVVTPRDYYF
jgi:hypothetical protein